MRDAAQDGGACASLREEPQVPCRKIADGKWRLGQNGPTYKSEEACQRGYKAYLWRKANEKKGGKDGRVRMEG